MYRYLPTRSIDTIFSFDPYAIFNSHLIRLDNNNITYKIDDETIYYIMDDLRIDKVSRPREFNWCVFDILHYIMIIYS